MVSGTVATLSGFVVMFTDNQMISIVMLTKLEVIKSLNCSAKKEMSRLLVGNANANLLTTGLFWRKTNRSMTRRK